MKLILSSAAAPDATLEELVGAAARRGFAGLELEEGHGHGLNPYEPWAAVIQGPPARQARRVAREGGAPVVAYRLRTPRRLARALTLARLLEVPVLLDPSDLRGLGAGTIPSGSRVLLVTGGGRWELPALREALEELGPRAGVAWTVDTSAPDEEPAAVLGRLREAVGDALEHVRLAGGGPEAASHEGRGIGALMAHLALSGFRGSVSLVPSSSRYRVIWSAWLGRRGGWGCGGKESAPGLVSLDVAGGSP